MRSWLGGVFFLERVGLEVVLPSRGLRADEAGAGAGEGYMDGRDWEKCCGDSSVGHRQGKLLRLHIC